MGPCRPFGGIFSYPGGSVLSIYEYRSFLCSVFSISVTSSVPPLMVRSFVSLSERFALKCRLDNSREVTLPVQQAPIGHLQALALGYVCGTEVETSGPSVEEVTVCKRQSLPGDYSIQTKARKQSTSKEGVCWAGEERRVIVP